MHVKIKFSNVYKGVEDLHFILSVNLPAHIVVKATLSEKTRTLAKLFLSYKFSNQAVNRCVCVSTLMCWLNAKRLFNSMYMFWMQASILLYSISCSRSRVWILLSRNVSITFHKSIKCTLIQKAQTMSIQLFFVKLNTYNLTFFVWNEAWRPSDRWQTG